MIALITFGVDFTAVQMLLSKGFEITMTAGDREESFKKQQVTWIQVDAEKKRIDMDQLPADGT